MMLILAPMVRVSTLPMRLLAIKYGANCVYSPEIIDRRLIGSTRTVNTRLNTVDFVESDGRVCLRVHSSERNKLVVQLGTSDPILALEAAMKISNDVAGIDLNCGCPVHFSVVSGMGSALLENQETLLAILTTLVDHLNIPVTAKIRLLFASESQGWMDRTISLLKRIQGTGVAAIGVHARFTNEKPREPAHWDVFETLADAIDIPLIANGDIWNYNDALKLKSLTNGKISRFMIARGAQENVSVFRQEGPLPILQVMKEMCQLGIETETPVANMKYLLTRMAHTMNRHSFTMALTRTRDVHLMAQIIDKEISLDVI